MLVRTHNSTCKNYFFEAWKLYEYHVPMLKVALKVRKLGKMDDNTSLTHHKFVPKLLKTTVFGKKCFWEKKRK